MTVAELIGLLSKLEPDRVVVMSSDGEGNSYSPLSDLDERLYVPDSTWCGTVYMERKEDGAPPDGYDDEDCYDGTGGQRAVVLFPVN